MLRLDFLKKKTERERATTIRLSMCVIYGVKFTACQYSRGNFTDFNKCTIQSSPAGKYIPTENEKTAAS